MPHDLDEIVRRLSKHHQRATYGAVGVLIGVPAQSMGGRLGSHSKPKSFIVAATTKRKNGSRRGFPTGYEDRDSDPQLESIEGWIQSPSDLKKWFDSHS